MLLVCEPDCVWFNKLSDCKAPLIWASAEEDGCMSNTLTNVKLHYRYIPILSEKNLRSNAHFHYMQVRCVIP